MKYVSTRKGFEATSAETVFQGLAPDGGLYVPSKVEKVEGLEKVATLREAEELVMNALFGDLPAEVRAAAADRLCARFPEGDPIPLVEKDGLQILELFHGKTGAFKDVALSMLPVFMKHAANGKRVLILTATSGDTGSAAMQGFAGVDGTEIIVFYPATGTSKIQRLQMTTPADKNVHAVGIRGNFDDAQAAVKRIFADKAIAAEAAAHGITLSSANSINTGRLVPQIAYYVLAAERLRKTGSQIPDFKCDVVVPSGNFGNLTSGLIAKKMGAPITGFVAATNTNRTIPDWIATGDYNARPSVETYANAMDVGAPSNYERIKAMYSLDQVRELFGSYWLDNDGIKSAVQECYKNTGYIIDPHGAIGYKAWDDIKSGAMEALKNGTKNDYTKPGLTPNLPVWADKVINKEASGIILETASPAKFGSTVTDAIGRQPPMPDRLEAVLRLEDRAIPMNNNYEEFKAWLLANLQ